MADEILDRWINVGGVKTHYLTLGNGAPIVLLHGGALGVSAAENWRKNIPALAGGGFSVYAPEIVGSGETDKPAGCHTIAAKIRHVEEFLDALCLDRVCLVGNALGASLALAIANDLAERVPAAVVMGGPGAPHGRESAGLNRLTAIADAYSREGIRASLETLCFDTSLISDELVERRFRLAQLPGAREVFSAFISSPDGGRSMWDRVQGFLPKIAQPVMVLWGKEDGILPVELAHKLASTLPHARLEIVESCGHWVQIERPEVFNRLVRDFFESQRASKSAHLESS